MGRIILPALVAFLLGLGGTSAMAVMKAKHARVAADNASAHATHRDSTVAAHAPLDSAAVAVAAIAQVDGARHGGTMDSAAHAAPGADLHAAPARRGDASGVPAVPSPIATGSGAHPLPPVAKREPVPAAEPATAPLQERRLAKIFSAMSPKDAARVLLQMGDDDVHVILGNLGDRQAAAILANFPPQRAALVGRAVMRPAATPPVAARGTGMGAGR